MENVIVFENVSKSFDPFQLKEISFTVKKGYITGFIGPNGAGKTSTIKLLLNLLHKDAGSIHVFGQDASKHEVAVKQRIGFVHAENYFYDEWTVTTAKNVISKFYTQWDEELFQKYVTTFQLPMHKKIKELSTGTRMKFSLALALSHHADLLVLDEPTSGLDPVFRQDFLDLLTDFVQDGEKTVFFSTHITTDLDQLADYIVFLHQGSILWSDEKEQILSQYRLIQGPTDFLTPAIRNMCIGIKETDAGFEALTMEWEKIRAHAHDQLTAIPPSLEQIMVYIVKG